MSAPIPATMRAAVTRVPGEARLEDVPVPALGPGDALVKTAVVGACAGDVASWYVARKVPCVLGHEPAGTVVAVGPDVRRVAVGDRVFFHHHAPCFECRHCLAGRPTLCATWRATRLDPGGLAEYVRVPAANLGDTLPLPDDVSLEDAALVEPLACCVKACRRVGLSAGESVLVIGLGGNGLMLAMLARALGARPVVGTDLLEARRRRALGGACDAVVASGTPAEIAARVREVNAGQLADAVFVAPGDRRAMEAGLACVAPGGRWCCFWPTPPEEPLPISTHDLYFNEVTLHFSYSCGPAETREALEWIRQGVVRASDLVTHRFPLDRVAEAFAFVKSPGDGLKALVVVDPTQR